MACEADGCAAGVGLLGAAGECQGDGSCLCPEGFSGTGPWRAAEDCHVHLGLLRVGAAIATGVGALSAIIGVVTLLFLVRHLGGLRHRALASSNMLSAFADTRRRESDIKSTDAALSTLSTTPRGNWDDGAASEAASEAPKAHRVRAPRPRPPRVLREAARKKRDTFISVILLILFAISNSLSSALIFNGYRRYDPDDPETSLFLDVCLATTSASFLVGLWFVTYVWFRALPVYAPGSLGEASIIVRNAPLVRGITTAHVVIITIGAYVLQCIVPIFVPEKRRLLDIIWVLLAAYYLLSFMAYFNLLVMALRQLFLRMRELEVANYGDGEPSQPTSKLVTIDHFLRTTVLMLAVNNVFVPATVVCFLFALAPGNEYFSLGAVAMVAHFGAFMVYFFLAVRLSGRRIGSSRGGSSGRT